MWPDFLSEVDLDFCQFFWGKRCLWLVKWVIVYGNGKDSTKRQLSNWQFGKSEEIVQFCMTRASISIESVMIVAKHCLSVCFLKTICNPIHCGYSVRKLGAILWVMEKYWCYMDVDGEEIGATKDCKERSSTSCIIGSETVLETTKQKAIGAIWLSLSLLIVYI